MNGTKLYPNAPLEEFEQFEKTHNEMLERGFVLKDEAIKLTEFESKYLVCTACKIPIDKFILRTDFTFPDKNKKDLRIGFVGFCMNCFFLDLKNS